MVVSQTIGILAYGSLISNPDKEIERARTSVIENVETPFNIEFARSSSGRDGAPTLVPVKTGGAKVNGQVFIVDLSEDEATNALYRREINAVGSDRCYNPPNEVGKNTVLVERIKNFAGLDVVLYTKIGTNIDHLTPERLAKLAIKSVAKDKAYRDGISYLISAKTHGIVTALSPAYEAEILRQTRCESLEEALETLIKGE